MPVNYQEKKPCCLLRKVCTGSHVPSNCFLNSCELRKSNEGIEINGSGREAIKLKWSCKWGLWGISQGHGNDDKRYLLYLGVKRSPKNHLKTVNPMGVRENGYLRLY